MKAKDQMIKIIKRLQLEKDPNDFYAELFDRMLGNMQRSFPDERTRAEDACILAVYETQESFITKLENK